MNGNNQLINAIETSGGFRPHFALYHPNAKGTGCALKMSLYPAHGDVDGCIMLSMANQKTVADMHGAVRRFATFDWENRICVKLGFSDICKILQVLRGECEAIDDGKGLFHRTTVLSTRIVFRHLLEPVVGYSLEIYRDGRGGESKSAHLILNASEAMGVAIAFENSIGVICFGIPSAGVQSVCSEEPCRDEAVA